MSRKRNSPNMSYCAFENTELALLQIRDIISEYSSMSELLADASSDEERASMKRFMRLLENTLGDLEDLNMEDVAGR